MHSPHLVMAPCALALLLVCPLACTKPNTNTAAPSREVAAPPAPQPLSLVVQPPALGGKWRAEGASPPDPNGRRMGWFAEYTFRPDGTFSMTGYPPIAVSGRYKELARESMRVRVRLFEQKMGASAWPDGEVDFIFSTNGKSFRWGDREYRRR